MATSSDLPAELVYRIIEYTVLRDPDPEDWESYLPALDDAIGLIKPKPRPHLERHRNPYPPRWADPPNPLLALSLVNRTFRMCAQELLFRNAALQTTHKARLFLQALTCTSPLDKPTLTAGQDNQRHTKGDQNHNMNMAQLSEIDHSCPSRLARHVRSLQIEFNDICSLARGSSQWLCAIIRSCPRLENIAISSEVWDDCREPILEALSLIQEFAVLENYSLETVELSELKRRTGTVGKPIPTLNCTVRTMILHNPRLYERDLAILLTSFRQSIRSLTIEMSDPDHSMGRPGLCRILKDCTNPDLECLKVKTGRARFDDLADLMQSPSAIVDPDDPSSNPGLLDFVFKSPFALRKLKSLSFSGNLATNELFKFLPDSIVKLAWDNCEISLWALGSALSRRADKIILLPNLKCCSTRAPSSTLESELEARGGFFTRISRRCEAQLI
ncbi:hypothetical protein PtB15_1B706 [Puccinia triticina]|nr:hypothetical protein PtB15_1B706 [Puccinia triticina]